MSSLKTNRASDTPSELRVGLTTAAVVAAYIHEISERHRASDEEAKPSGPQRRRSRRSAQHSPMSHGRRLSRVLSSPPPSVR